VRLTDEEVARLAAFQRLGEFDFIQRFARIRPDRSGLALREKSNGECIFLVGDDCAVQPVKPQQCRDFPNLWRFPGFQSACQALAQDVSVEERLALLAQATGRAAEELEGLLPPVAGERGENNVAN